MINITRHNQKFASEIKIGTIVLSRYTPQ